MHGMYCPRKEVDVHSTNIHVESHVLNNVTMTVYVIHFGILLTVRNNSGWYTNTCMYISCACMCWYYGDGRLLELLNIMIFV